MRRRKAITLTQLKRAEACQSAYDLFATNFPNGMPLTVRNVRRALRIFSADYITWFMGKLSARQRAVLLAGVRRGPGYSGACIMRACPICHPLPHTLESARRIVAVLAPLKKKER